MCVAMESLLLTSTQHRKQAYVHKCLTTLLHTKQNTLLETKSQVLICHVLGKDFYVTCYSKIGQR